MIRLTSVAENLSWASSATTTTTTSRESSRIYLCRHINIEYTQNECRNLSEREQSTSAYGHNPNTKSNGKLAIGICNETKDSVQTPDCFQSVGNEEPFDLPSHNSAKSFK